MCGVVPFDDLQVLKLLKKEMPDQPLSPAAAEVLEYVRKVKKEREELNEKFKKVKEKEVVFSGKKRFFTSTYAQVLTNPMNIAYLRLDEIWREVKGLKVEELRLWILAQPECSTEDLIGSTGKKLTLPELKNKVFEEIKKMHAILELGVKRWIEKNKVRLPNTEELMREGSELAQ